MTTFVQCPSCGAWHSPERAARGPTPGPRTHTHNSTPTPTWQRRPHDAGSLHRVRFGDGGGEQQVAQFQTFRAPARPAEWTADVTVPAAQSGITGALAAIVAVPVALVVYGYVEIPAWLAATIPLWSGAIATAMMWIMLLSDHQRHLWTEESYESTPPPFPSPAPPAPAPASLGVRLEVVEDRSMKFANLPVDAARLKTLARALLDGKRPFTVGEWTGAGKLMTRNEYESLRTWLMESGFLRWVDDAARARGVEFTNGGRALLRALRDA
jgi:hypothetical protein